MSTVESLETTINQESKKDKRKISFLKSTTLFWTDGKWRNTEYFLSDLQAKSTSSQIQHHWSWKQFLIALFIHIIFYTLLGPFTYLVFYKYRILLRNFEFWGKSKMFFTQTLIYMTLLVIETNIFVFGANSCEQYEFGEIIFFMILRSVSISAKYATLDAETFNRYKEMKISNKEFQEELTIYWYQQDEAFVVKDIIRSLKADNDDISVFFIDFFLPLDAYTKETLQNIEKKCFKMYKEINDQEDSIQENFENAKNRLNCKQKDELFNGCTIFMHFINEYHSKRSFKPIIVISILMSLGRCSIIYVIFYITNYQFEHVSDFIIQITSTLLLLYSSCVNSFFLILIIRDQKKKLFKLIQLCNSSYLIHFQAYLILIQRNKNAYYQESKLLPTTNICCKYTLTSWGVLRRLTYQYGYKYWLRQQSYLTAYILFNFAQMVYIILQFFHIVPCILYIQSVAIYDLVFNLAIIIPIFYYIAQINQHFDLHRDILQANKHLLTSLYHLKEFYCKDFNSNNLLTMEIANKIKNSISQEKDIDSEIESFTSILVEIYQNEIERIEFEKETKPYNILGISITNKLIVSTLIAALSVLPASILSNL